MGIVLDTSALVDLQRRGETLSGSLPEEVTEVYLPAVVLAEIWIGVELAPSTKLKESRREEVHGLLAGTTVIPFSQELASIYARLYAQLRTQGKLIPANDLAVATTAVHYGHELLVGQNDEAHFRSVPGLKVRVL